MFELARRLVELQTKRDEHKAILTELNREIEELQAKLTREMVDQEVQSFKRDGRTFYLRTDTFISDVAPKRSDLHDALKAEGFGDLIKPTVHPQTLKAFVKEQMRENDDDLPGWLEGLVSVFRKDNVVVKKSE